MNAQPVIVSRHPAAIEFIRQKAGLPDDTPILAQVAEPTDVHGRAVYGNVPLRIACEAERVVAVEFDGDPPRGREYTLEDMQSAGACLRTYHVLTPWTLADIETAGAETDENNAMLLDDAAKRIEGLERILREHSIPVPGESVPCRGI